MHDDVHDQRTIRQGQPPDWVTCEGDDYDLVVLGGGPDGLTAATTAAAGGAPRRYDRAATDRGHCTYTDPEVAGVA